MKFLLIVYLTSGHNGALTMEKFETLSQCRQAASAVSKVIDDKGRYWGKPYVTKCVRLGE